MALIIDSNSLCYQAKFSLSLDYDDMGTGIIFGFFLKILKLAQLFQTDEFIFVWDEKPYVRKEIFPEYKKKPKKELTIDEQEFEESCFLQFNKLKNTILKEIGFISLQEKGFEADDLIASITKNSPEDSFVIVSKDNDLLQLLSENVIFFDKEVYSLSDFKTQYGIDPKDWIDVKALSGCSSDSVPGIPSIGIKTACKYINKELKISSKAYQTIKAEQAIYKRNLSLVSLPFTDTPVIKIKKYPPLSYKAFTTMCQKYNFKSFLEKKKLNDFQKVLNFQ